METLGDLLRGDLSTTGRIWTALAPALLLAAYFLLGAVAFAVRNAVRGPYHDAELESRGDSPILGMWARLCFLWLLRPLWMLVLRTGVPANAVTTLSVLLAAAAGVALSSGRFALGGWLFIFSGVCDFLDGRLARARGQSSPAGAALDSVLDRYAELLVFGGLAWYYRDSWVLLLVLAAIGGSLLVSYVRAKGESLGVSFDNVGLMQRPERIAVLGASVAASPIAAALLVPGDPRPMHRLAVVGLLAVALMANATALQRLVHVLAVLEGRTRTGWLRTGRGSMLRNALSSVVATGADFATVWALVQAGGLPPALATLLGCVLGGAIHFSLLRAWALHGSGPYGRQVPRYGFASGTSALLNAGGMAVMAFVPGLDYRLAWVLVRVPVFLAWNFPLHRDYVFGGPVEPAPREGGSAT